MWAALHPYGTQLLLAARRGILKKSSRKFEIFHGAVTNHLTDRSPIVYFTVLMLRIPLILSLLSSSLGGATLSIGSLKEAPEIGTFERATPWATMHPFLNVGDGDAAKESTRLEMAYTATHLYVRGRASSFALNPSSNQSDSFIANARNRDEGVSEDDAVELRLEVQRAGGTRLYYVSVNALGTVQDMVFTKDGWDKAWDGVEQAKARQGRGYWEFELAIPWQSIGMTPGDGSFGLKLGAVRFDRLNNEASSWVYLSDGDFHSAKARGTIRLDANTPLITGENEFPLRRSTPTRWSFGKGSGDEPLWWRVELLDGRDVVANASGEVDPAADEVAVVIPALAKSIQTPVRARIFWIRGEQVLYESTELPYENQSSEARLKIVAEEPVAIYLNGEKLAVYQPGEPDIPCPLEEGANLLSLQTKADMPLSVDLLDANGLPIISGEGWQVAAGESSKTLDHSASESSTVPATMLPDSHGKMTSGGSGTVTYRRIILHRHTRFHRQSAGNHWQLTEGATALFRWDGPTYSRRAYPHALQKMKLYLDLPEELEFVGASGAARSLVSGKPVGISQKWRDAGYTWKEHGEVMRGERLFRRYEISRELAVDPPKEKESWLERQYRIREGVSFGIRPKKGAQGESGMLYFWLEAEDGKISETPQASRFTVHSPLKGVAPKKVRLALTARDGHVKDDALAKAYFETVARAGVNYVFGETGLPDLASLGLQQSYFFELTESGNHNANSTTPIVDRLLAAYPEARAIGFDGAPQTTPCLVYLARHPEVWTFLQEEIRNVKNRNPSLTHFFWDYEYSPFPGHHPIYPGFSAFGRETFAKENGLTSVPSAAEIRESHAAAWIDFTAKAIADVMERLRTISNQEGLKLDIYSGYYLPYTLENYNVDWKRLGGKIDAAICGYSSDRATIEGTREVLGKTPLIGALLLMGETYQAHTPADIIAKLVTHPAGVLFWYESGFDAIALASIAEVSRFVSRYELFFTEGVAHDALPGGTIDDQISIFHRGDEWLVIARNNVSSKVLHRDVPIPKGMRVKDIPKDARLEGESVALSVPVGQFRAYVIEPKIDP